MRESSGNQYTVKRGWSDPAEFISSLGSAATEISSSQCHRLFFPESLLAIWLERARDLDDYDVYDINNILQMRKSQIECKLDHDQRQAAENQAIEMLDCSDDPSPPNCYRV